MSNGEKPSEKMDKSVSWSKFKERISKAKELRRFRRAKRAITNNTLLNSIRMAKLTS